MADGSVEKGSVQPTKIPNRFARPTWAIVLDIIPDKRGRLVCRQELPDLPAMALNESVFERERVSYGKDSPRMDAKQHGFDRSVYRDWQRFEAS